MIIYIKEQNSLLIISQFSGLLSSGLEEGVKLEQVSFDEGLDGLLGGFGGKLDFEISISFYNLVVVVVFQV